MATRFFEDFADRVSTIIGVNGDAQKEGERECVCALLVTRVGWMCACGTC
jgi:hypothetical protein